VERPATGVRRLRCGCERVRDGPAGCGWRGGVIVCGGRSVTAVGFIVVYGSVVVAFGLGLSTVGDERKSRCGVGWGCGCGTWVGGS